jgi:hypothetical protein
MARLVVRVEVLGGQARSAFGPDHLHAGLADSAARIPPATPTPMMTTSFFPVAMARVLRIVVLTEPADR